MTQTRWICGGCDREWVWAHNWTAEAGCPLCGHDGIRQETYTPRFPGDDIPRPDRALLAADQREVVAAAAAAIIRANGERFATRNTTLAASSPEFE